MAVLIVTISTILIGASGCVIIIAPLPILDCNENPIEFCAYTVANTLEPKVRLKGNDASVDSGTKQKVLVTIDD